MKYSYYSINYPEFHLKEAILLTSEQISSYQPETEGRILGAHKVNAPLPRHGWQAKRAGVPLSKRLSLI